MLLVCPSIKILTLDFSFKYLTSLSSSTNEFPLSWKELFENCTFLRQFHPFSLEIISISTDDIF